MEKIRIIRMKLQEKKRIDEGGDEKEEVEKLTDGIQCGLLGCQAPGPTQELFLGLTSKEPTGGQGPVEDINKNDNTRLDEKNDDPDPKEKVETGPSLARGSEKGKQGLDNSLLNEVGSYDEILLESNNPSKAGLIANLPDKVPEPEGEEKEESFLIGCEKEELPYIGQEEDIFSRLCLSCLYSPCLCVLLKAELKIAALKKSTDTPVIQEIIESIINETMEVVKPKIYGTRLKPQPKPKPTSLNQPGSKNAQKMKTKNKPKPVEPAKPD